MWRRSFFCISALSGAFSFGAYENFEKEKVAFYQLTNEERLVKLNEAESKIDEKSLSAEEYLALSSLIALEKINCMEDEKEKYLLLEKCDNENCLYMKGKKLSSFNKYFLLSCADIKSRCLAYLSTQNQITQSAEAKKLYGIALKKDKKFSKAHMSYALYLYFAPPIAGGGYEVALKEATRAVSSARKDYEKYFSLCFRSQFYFAKGQKEKAEKDLQKAASLFAGETFTSVIREMNANGKLFFD